MRMLDPSCWTTHATKTPITATKGRSPTFAITAMKTRIVSLSLPRLHWIPVEKRSPVTITENPQAKKERKIREEKRRGEYERLKVVGVGWEGGGDEEERSRW
ncbi:hypothetical protein Syun_020471 [Stephania yunnanensis]|uniref:Uncharacterized protein n=1 Tax=Stephania yunnanensis TaxID=152371 RepID=A0AAP0IDW1_9MAGN